MEWEKSLRHRRLAKTVKRRFQTTITAWRLFLLRHRLQLKVLREKELEKFQEGVFSSTSSSGRGRYRQDVFREGGGLAETGVRGPWEVVGREERERQGERKKGPAMK